LPAELFLSGSAVVEGVCLGCAGRRMVLHVNDTHEMRIKPTTATVLMKRDRTTTVADGCGRGGSVGGGFRCGGEVVMME